MIMVLRRCIFITGARCTQYSTVRQGTNQHSTV